MLKESYKLKGFQIVDNVTKTTKNTEAGSLKYLLKGSVPSEQSLFIKLGKQFEDWFKFMIDDCGYKLLPHGITKNVNGKSKDIDLLFVGEDKKIYYMELKSNIELDTEKNKATYDKVKEICSYLDTKYSEYTIDSSILCWSVYSVNDLSQKFKYKINKVKQKGVNIIFPIDLFKMLNININGDEYYDFFKQINERIEMKGDAI